MIVREVEAPIYLAPSESPRSEGVHLSGIIRSIAGLTGILKAEWVEDLSLLDVREITDPVAILRMNIGLAWENWYIPKFLAERGVVHQPGECQVDGIYMTSDGESVDVIVTEEGWREWAILIHECKATYKSTKTVGDLTDQWMWLTQLKGYCKAKNTRFAMMHILFICGDYTYPIKPLLKAWLIEFSQEEIDSTWQMLKEYTVYRLAEDSRLLLLETDSNQ